MKTLGLALCAGLLGCSGQSEVEGVHLADAVIVRTVPDDKGAASVMADVVSDLTNVIFRKTGRLAPVCERVPEDARAVIYMGEAAVAASGADVSCLRFGDWRVKVEPGKVFLLGRTPLAVNAAMVEFAARFCDYHFITVDGSDTSTVKPDLSVPVCDITVRPSIYVRDLYHGAYYDGRTAPEVHDAWRTYSRRRRQMTAHDVEPAYWVSRQVRSCHSTFDYLPPGKWFKDHPEY